MTPPDLTMSYGESAYTFKVSSRGVHPPSREGAMVPFSGDQLADLIHSRLFGGTCIEIGSGEGVNTVFLANACRFSLLVCVDGSEITRRYFDDNIRTNCAVQMPVWISESFVSDVPDVFYNLPSPSGKCPAFISLVKLSESSQPVKSVTLDQVAEGLPRIDLICVDADNHEMEVIASGAAVFRKHRPELCIKAGAGSWEMMDEKLGSQGYRLLKRFHDGYSYYVPDAGFSAKCAALAAKLPAGLGYRVGRYGSRISLLFRSLVRFGRVDVGEAAGRFSKVAP